MKKESRDYPFLYDPSFKYFLYFILSVSECYGCNKKAWRWMWGLMRKCYMRYQLMFDNFDPASNAITGLIVSFDFTIRVIWKKVLIVYSELDPFCDANHCKNSMWHCKDWLIKVWKKQQIQTTKLLSHCSISMVFFLTNRFRFLLKSYYQITSDSVSMWQLNQLILNNKSV